MTHKRLMASIKKDRIWNQVAAERDTESARFASHKKAWASAKKKSRQNKNA
jgi:hypothetical protein